MSILKPGRPVAPDDVWVPRRRSAKPPRRYRGQVVSRWAAAAVCAGILVALLIVGR